MTKNPLVSIIIPTKNSSQYLNQCLQTIKHQNNPNIEFTFEDCFPTSLGAITLATDTSEVEYVVADLTFRYTLFKIRTST